MGGSLLRWLVATICKLPPRIGGRLQVERDLLIPMRDGVALRADRYSVRGKPVEAVVLMRSPYGRGAIFAMMAALIAERGFHVLLQSVRGTGGSGGTLNPMRQEQADGADTVAWVRQQSWFPGKLFTFGGSYLGNAQWAMASEVGDKIDGLALAMTLSNFRDELLSFGGYTQGGTLAWTQTALMMTEPGAKMQRPKPGSLDHAHTQLPLGAIDQVAFGKTVSWWQDWVTHDDPGDPWWQTIDHSAAVSSVQAPTSMVAGWQDIFLPFQIKDFEARQAAGRDAWLVIGPWSHIAPGGMVESVRQALIFFSALAADKTPHTDRQRVRLYLQGADQWREYPAWPPPSTAVTFHLRAGERIDPASPEVDEGATRFTYDPSDPTPAVHGPMVMADSKIRDMTALEQRDDTVVFTAESFDCDVDIIGPVTAQLSVRSDREHTDFYVCLCDVDSKRRSIQVTDGYVRLKPGKFDADAAGVRSVTIECWPTAYRFKRGHKLRLIIASGAHPRYARNPGTGEPLAKAVTMVAAQQQVLHGVEYGSSITLPMINAG